MKTTGKYSVKLYKCRKCGKTEKHGTNHWGAIYNCCGWCRPGFSAVLDCLEAPPKGVGIPEEWKMVKLGDVCTITELKAVQNV